MKKLILALAGLMALVVIVLMSTANTTSVSAQPSWIPCPTPRTEEEGVYMWGKFPVEDTCVFAKGSIPDLSSVERLSNGVQFVCLNKADGWSVTFFSEPNYKGTGWWVANCGRADLPWQPGSVKIERIDSNPPWVVPGLNLRPVYLPHISS